MEPDCLVLKEAALVEKRALANQRGFTLIEVIASLVIVGVLSSVAVHRYYTIEVNAQKTLLLAAAQELNTRELVGWLDAKMSRDGYPGDELLFAAISKDLGSDYSWDAGPGLGGGTLRLGTQNSVLLRTPSDSGTPGRWQ
jgi:prepilin-type N-terminal cleavage/methylation domain-containing protein